MSCILSLSLNPALHKSKRSKETREEQFDGECAQILRGEWTWFRTWANLILDQNMWQGVWVTRNLQKVHRKAQT